MGVVGHVKEEKLQRHRHTKPNKWLNDGNLSVPMPQMELNERNDIHEVGRSLNSEMMKDIRWKGPQSDASCADFTAKFMLNISSRKPGRGSQGCHDGSISYRSSDFCLQQDDLVWKCYIPSTLYCNNFQIFAVSSPSAPVPSIRRNVWLSYRITLEKTSWRVIAQNYKALDV